MGSCQNDLVMLDLGMQPFPIQFLDPVWKSVRDQLQQAVGKQPPCFGREKSAREWVWVVPAQWASVGS